MSTRNKKSDSYYISIPDGVSKDQMHGVVTRAVESVGLYISHIGKYMAHKHPGSVHWHFKRDKGEAGIVDATFFDVESRFWLMIGHRNPQWVKDIVPALVAALEKEIAALPA
ncbi:MAG: hypothetical protein RL839_09730 [Gammaproteobacteria bacterium]